MIDVERNERCNTNIFFFIFVVPILGFHPWIHAQILSSSQSLTNPKTIVSLGDDFELGFFSISGDRWYIGIWYKKITERTYVWVANRDNPLSNSAGTLKISGINLVILNQSDIPVWSTNLTRSVSSPVVAELLGSGNLVLRDSKTTDQDGFLWQSFDYPTDTLLPHMKLGLNLTSGHNRFLTAWKNVFDPSSSNVSFRLQTRRLYEFIIWHVEFPGFRSGQWDGKRFSGIPDMQRWAEYNVVYNFTENKEEVVFSLKVTTPSKYARFIITFQGILQLFTSDTTTRTWTSAWMLSMDDCLSYMICNSYAFCDTSTSSRCNCFKGFVPSNPTTLDSGTLVCVRKTNLSCRGDGFIKMSNMKMPHTLGAIIDRRIGLKECGERCMNDCKCTMYTNIRDGGSGCVIWTGELRDVRRFVNAGQDLYLRLAAADLVEANNKSGKNRTIVGLSVGATVLLIMSFIIFFWRKKHMHAKTIAAASEYGRSRQNLLRTWGRHLSGEDSDLPLMEYDVVSMATDNFSDNNKLGEGGFGTVYKGRLPDGEEIAVKRLSKVSTQGNDEFKTELILIAKLQHINLVRLLGCYADEDEKILVYEYLENLSLDFYLFDKTKSYELNWEKRFNIIKGIARGLLYLHHDSRCRVIHRDLKASNILLDKDMIPKISDFGMARIFARDEEEATTRRIVGTHGYMSPEYVTDGVYSEKSDVFSFGVLILEIVCGKKNRGFTILDRDSNLLSYVWRNMEEGTENSVVDPNIIDLSSPTYPKDEISRCIKIGLMCVQHYAEDRPAMPWVVYMLGNETEVIPKPKPPAYYVEKSSGNTPCDTESSSSSTATAFTNLRFKAR